MAKTLVKEDPRVPLMNSLLCARIASGNPITEKFIREAAAASTLIVREQQQLEWIPGPDDLQLKTDAAFDICRRFKKLCRDAGGDKSQLNDQVLVDIFNDVEKVV